MQWLRGPYGCPHGVGVCSRKHYKDEVCKEWLNGRCERSAQECKFVHDEDVTLFTWNPHNPKCEQFKGPNTSWTMNRDGSWQYIHICQACTSNDPPATSTTDVSSHPRDPLSTPSKIGCGGVVAISTPATTPPQSNSPADFIDISDEMDARISDLMKMQYEKKCYFAELKRLDDALSLLNQEVQTRMAAYMRKRQDAELAGGEVLNLRDKLSEMEDALQLKNQEAQEAKECYIEANDMLTKQTGEADAARAKIKKKLLKIEKKQSKMAGKAKDKSKEDVGHDHVCCVCLENEPSFIFVECGHMCICDKCHINMNKCPMCQTAGKARKVFM